jgi:hypothetical protein
MPWAVGTAQIARATDPYQRHVETVGEAIQAHVPFWSQGLTPNRNIFGEPIRQATALPGIYAKAIDNPMAKEMFDIGLFPAKLRKEIDGVELNERQYDDYQRIAGRFFSLRLQSLMQMPGWNTYPAQVRADVISKNLTKARETARAQMKIENPDLVSAIKASTIEDYKARMSR